VEIRLDRLSAARRDGASLELNLFTDATFTATLERIDQTARGFVWVGRIADVPHSSVTLSVDGTTVYGSIHMPGGTFLVKPAGNGISTIVEIDQSLFPPEVEPLVPAVVPDAPASPAAPMGQADDGSFIDVLVVYTPSAAAALGGTAGINALIANAISVTNTAYANSGVTQRVRLASAQAVTYVESGNSSTDLSNLTNGVGALSGVAALRDTYRADLVSLFTHTPAATACGVAWLMSTISSTFAPAGYSVVEQMCAVGNLTFPHELGHNMGLRHDWYVDSGVTPATYAHGYVNDAGRWRTIMAYNNRCAAQGFNCTRVAYFSNPNVTYLGAATGVPAGTSTACVVGSLSGNCDADSRRLLNESAFTVSNFRQAASPGSLVTIDFGPAFGLWNYVSAGSWQPLHALSPSVLLRADLDGNGVIDVVAVFPGYGVWAYMNISSWVVLHALDATEAKAGDVNGNGIADLVLSFPGLGVWLRSDSAAWTQLHPLNPNRMAVGNIDGGTGRADVIMSFAGLGLWAYMNAASWQQLHPLPTLDLQVGDLDGNGQGDVIAIFTGYGEWVFGNNTSWWQLHPIDAAGITVGNVDGDGAKRSDVVLRWPIYGTWMYTNGTSWTQLHPLTPSVLAAADLDANGKEEVLMGFPGYGLFAWTNNTSYTQLHSVVPELVAGAR
jgi:hypothetical protein